MFTGRSGYRRISELLLPPEVATLNVIFLFLWIYTDPVRDR